jgi:hypothetical protein
MAKSEGTEVRHAMNGPDIEHDVLIGKIDKWNGEDRARASTAAETRGEIGEFTERTGLHPKALSFLRLIKKTAGKDGGQAKAMDIIRSIKKGLPMVEADVAGQADLPGLDEEPVAVDPAPLGKPSYDPDADFAEVGVVPATEGEVVGFADDEIAEEADDFEAQLAQVAEAAE